MKTQKQSKFIARFDSSANAANKRPTIVGSFALASDGVVRSLRAWSGVSESGTTYLRGTHEPESLTGAVKSRHAQTVDSEAPPSITLKPGELVLFENPGLADNEKRPNWYGYARTNECYVRLSGWDRKGEGGAKLIAGTAEPYRPGDPVNAAASEENLTL